MTEKIVSDEIKIFSRWLAEAKRAVFFGGAGVSTESGIPDFRSADGLYNQKYAYPPEVILSHTFFERNVDEFYRFYHDKMLYLDARPNACHQKLAELERTGHLKSIVTQNIDGLHLLAGSQNVLELHGSVHRNYCQHCGRFFDAHYMKQAVGVPRCECGGIIKPDVVLYEEGLDTGTLLDAIHDIQDADLLIVGGTSLVVYPAAGLIDYYQGNRLVLINMSATAADKRANLIIRKPIGKVFSEAQ